MGIMFKAFVCCVIELIYFFGLVDTVCHGPIYVYELTLACVHIGVLLVAAGALVKNWCF